MRRILVVDDSATMRKMVMASLRDVKDVAFSEAGNGLEAIEQLEIAPFDLMILDLNMPDMHGLEVLRFVLNHPEYRETPIVILTTKGDDESRSEAIAAGAACYLTKPFHPKSLSGEIVNLLSEPCASNIN
ncbi:MAG: response regulator [Limnospira sp. PMC 1291.21]|uniref:Chemotaxis protein cheY Two-component response regulator n=3 Tax=Limnospira TaxID=2596745 RepID=A0A9P1KLJ9_9CYAN|nr:MULTISPECIES: response regulator [Limnospira]AMW27167.1 two-component system response regulator [Arthrospira platensis YZ]MDC0839446.1 response regulator [Limnoraphis robusta]MDY7052533.1 response regulator [Limnospira fusiformis LS22]QJB24538.1 response regulator [Limnospira fusiformis SAG 85.79]RAQ42601.1 response regulator [Arthrospira sp. O9.13F]UWU46087.1 two-component system, chemotaxis family, response regulator CheY [Arthrospira platensis C1]